MRRIKTNATKNSVALWLKFDGNADGPVNKFLRELSTRFGVKAVKEIHPGAGIPHVSCIMEKGETFPFEKVAIYALSTGFELVQTKG